MTYKHFLFDLDGTLTDPALGITNSILYAMEKFGLEKVAREKLYCFIGPPLLDMFCSQFGVSREESQTMLTLYREYFSTKGLFENKVYDGVAETLAALKERGARLYLASSKPEIFVKQILAHFKLDQYFTFIGGSTMEETRTKKEDVIAYVMEEGKVPKEGALMVGDRLYDIEGAHANGIAAAGVLFGYGNRKELKDAEHILETFEELLNL